MRQDQYEKLQALAEKLTDVFIAEAECDDWPGAGVPAANMSAQTRGDRYWCKKNAVATVSLIQRVNVLVGLIQQNSNAGTGAGAVAGEPEEAEPKTLDEEVSKAEKEAKQLMNKALANAKKREFDKRTHGKT